MMKKKALLIISLMFLFLSTGCGNQVSLRDAHSNLETGERLWTDLAQDGSFIAVTVTVSCSPSDDSILCTRSHALNSLLEELGFGLNVRERMNQTRALDGRQVAENDNFRASWTFHPDDGLQVVFEYL